VPAADKSRTLLPRGTPAIPSVAVAHSTTRPDSQHASSHLEPSMSVEPLQSIETAALAGEFARALCALRRGLMIEVYPKTAGRQTPILLRNADLTQTSSSSKSLS